jgi:hypothetical protein
VEEHWSTSKISDTLANLVDLRKAGASMPGAIVAIVYAALNYRGQEISKRLAPFIEVCVNSTQLHTAP